MGALVNPEFRKMEDICVIIIIFYLSKMFDSPRGEMAHDIFSHQNSSQNEHNRCIFPSSFQKNSQLYQTFNVLGTSFDQDGLEFISLIENKKNQPPMYGAQVRTCI